jgi:hypothetical protein
MVFKAFPMLLLAALLFVGAPLAFASEHESEDATTTATTTRHEVEFKDTARFQELLAKFRTHIEQIRGQFDKKVDELKTKWEKGKSVAHVDASCVQKAVDTRETAMQDVFSKSNASISDALKVRQAALYAAWGLSIASTTASTTPSTVSARNVALKNAWSAWKDARNTAAKTMRTERDAAWKTYKTTMKNTCKAVVPKEDESAGQDILGQMAI